MKNLSQCLVAAGGLANDGASELQVIQQFEVAVRLGCSDWVPLFTLLKRPECHSLILTSTTDP